MTPDFAAVAERVRRSTVQVRNGGSGASGVVWSPEGLVVTNAHVARGPRTAIVLADGRRVEGRRVAADEWLDLAAYTIPVSEVFPAPLGDARALRPGELLIAVGHPFGMVDAVATGVVHAATGAALPGSSRRWVRADLRLAPGNSGGPLADARGRVVGINTMIAGGLALAIPSDDVARFVATGDRVAHLGVVTRPVRVRAAAAPGVGLAVMELEPRSAAAAAGLLAGDVLLAVDGEPFAAPDALPLAVRRHRPGDAVTLDLLRYGAMTRVTAVVRARGDRAHAA